MDFKNNIFYILIFTFILTTQLISSEIEFTEEEEGWLKNNLPITYVGDPDWLPFEAFDKNGNYIGIVADLIKYIEKTTPLKFKILKTLSWQDSIDAMNHGKAIMMSQSEDFNKQTNHLFTQSYYENPIVIVMGSKSHYLSSLYAIKDKNIAIDSSFSTFYEIKNKYPQINFKQVTSTKEGVESIIFGKNDAFINNLAQTSYTIAKLQLNEVRIVGRLDLTTKLGFGISKEDPLLKSIIDKVLNNIDPSIQNKLLSKWIKQEYIEKPDYKALYIALSIFCIIMLIALLFYIKIKKEIREKLEVQQKMLKQQSKMASMGEMLDAIAHQWKQPLNALSMYLDIMQSDFDDGIVDKAYIKDIENNMHSQITHMTTTLDEFRNFFRPNTAITNFNLLDALNSVMLLTKDEFLKNLITIEVDIDTSVMLRGNENEFKHLVLNLINNSKDAFNEKELTNRLIYIKGYIDKDLIKIQLKDNAGGIEENVIKKIFEANFTTKDEGKGTGIGLYMSSQIVQKMNGKISVKNIENTNGYGASFYINFDKIT